MRHTYAVLYWVLPQMKLPRSLRVLSLIAKVVPAYLRNESFDLEDSLHELDQLGGVYIKFLQMIALSSTGIEQKNFLQLLKVYEESTPDRLDIYAYLSTVDYPQLAAIANISPQP